MPDLNVVAAGSLLEFALKDISFPVGRVQFLQVHPMSFPEYLYAGGHEQAAKLVLPFTHKSSLIISRHPRARNRYTLVASRYNLSTLTDGPAVGHSCAPGIHQAWLPASLLLRAT